jgi:response regulator of citrate/malate metabolism
MKRFKRAINNLSKLENNLGLSQDKLDQLRRIADKAKAQVRVDLKGVKGTGVKPHAHVEGMGKKVELRHIWLQEGVK